MAVLHTERLIIRELRDSDVDPLYEIQGNQHHMRFTFWAESRAQCEHWLRLHERPRQTNGFAPWTVVHRSEDRVIGWAVLTWTRMLQVGALRSATSSIPRIRAKDSPPNSCRHLSDMVFAA